MQCRESREAEARSGDPDRDAVKRTRQRDRQVKRETTAAFGRGRRRG